MQYEEPLDKEQLAAVEAKDKAIAVLAGPGSGKTRVLSFRARHLLEREKGTNCLLLTFTNKAASEMKARAIAVTPAMSKRIDAGTFHHFAMGVLRSHGEHVGINQDFDVLDEQDKQELAQSAALAAKCRNESKAWSTARLRQRLATADVARFRDAFEALKRKEGVVDFDDLICYTVQLFQQMPEIAKAYARKFQHVLIDEFQDTNAAQFALVRALAEQASPNSTIGVFADDDQAIFGFAGAESQNISRFIDDLQAKTYPLTTNYRCTERIVEVANKLIKANRADGRHMKSNRKGGKVVLRTYPDLATEAEAITSEIAQLITKGTPPHDISILVRTASRVEAIHGALAEKGIPYSNWLTDAYNTKESRCVRACLAVVRPVMPNRTCRQLCEFLGIKEIPVGATVDTLEFLTANKERSSVSHLLAAKKLNDQGAKVSAIIVEVCKCIEAVDDELAGVKTLVEVVKAFEAHDPEYKLDHLLAELSLGGRGGAPTEGGGVKLATIHRTKGLQWPYVYLVGLEQDTLPHYYSTTEEQIREERRLCFVGVCRAEDFLTITRTGTYKGYAKAPSPFVEEMGL